MREREGSDLAEGSSLKNHSTVKFLSGCSLRCSDNYSLIIHVGQLLFVVLWLLRECERALHVLFSQRIHPV